MVTQRINESDEAFRERQRITRRAQLKRQKVHQQRVFPEAHHFVSKDHVQFEFSSSHPPVVKVNPGELVHVETNDCYHGKVQPESLSEWENQQTKTDRPKQGNSRGGTYVNGSILSEIPRSQLNPVTGPIYVNSARPGDVLAINLLDIRPKGVGVACCGSWAGSFRVG